MIDYQNALNTAVSAAAQVGTLLREGLGKPHLTSRLLGEADQLLQEQLGQATPWSYSSERSGFRPGSDSEHVWVVDPNNGGSRYHQGVRGSAVSIAALRQGTPVLGVVLAFAYPDHRGDLIAWAEGTGPIRRNGQPIATASIREVPLSGDPASIVLLSLGSDNQPFAALRCCAPARYRSIASLAYRLALIAVGEGVATVSLNGPTSWDYAAGHALLRAIDGILVDQHGQAVTYSAQGDSQCEQCFGGSPQAVAMLRTRPWTQPQPSPAQQTGPLFRGQRHEPARLAGLVISDADLLARAQGCLLGQLAGDSLGGLVEFSDARSIRQRYPQGVRQLADGGVWSNLAGQPTDDSELALLLARSLIAYRWYDPYLVLDNYLDWYNDPQTFDRGNTISQALSAGTRGTTPEQRLQLVRRYASRTSQSNGSLMRISPVGIYAAGRPELAADIARQDASLTHPHPVCVDSTACYAAALALAVGNGVSAQEVYQTALATACEPAVREVLQQAAQAPPSDYYSEQGWVLLALHNAFWQLLHANSLAEGVVDTVMAGGDTDTTGAIAGALLGAVHGREAVPTQWRHAVLSCRPAEGTPTRHPRAREYWPVDALELAECLLLAGQNVEG